MSFHGAPWLIRTEREAEERPSDAIAQLNLKPGMVVCDLGCGNGFYSLEMAKLVAPTGKVLAVDIQPEMLHLLELRSKEGGVEQKWTTKPACNIIGAVIMNLAAVDSSPGIRLVSLMGPTFTITRTIG